MNVTPQAEFLAGDWVEVRPLHEIQRTLDASDSLDQLPFMPEMIEFCGRRFRVARCINQVCLDGGLLCAHRGESSVRAFQKARVVTLEGLRCSGHSHGSCQKGCMLFWKVSWLKRCQPPADAQAEERELQDHPVAGLRTLSGPDQFFCQSSELLRATRHVAWWERFHTLRRDILTRNASWVAKIQQLLVWAVWKVHRRVYGAYPRGKLTATPVDSIGLQAGDWVEVKSLPEIVQTLDTKGCNRGLHFSPDMRLLCGKRFRVRNRLDRMIVEGVGRMRSLKNTVTLENVCCDSSYFAFGGCPRADLHYWREIWLKLVPAPTRELKPMDNASSAQPEEVVGLVYSIDGNSRSTPADAQASPRKPSALSTDSQLAQLFLTGTQFLSGLLPSLCL